MKMAKTQMINLENTKVLNTNFKNINVENMGGVKLEQLKTENHFLKDELLKLNNLYTEVLSAVPSKAVMINLKGEIISCSKEAQTELFTNDKGNFRGRLLKDLNFWGENTHIPRALLEALSHKQTYGTSFAQLNPNETTTTWDLKMEPLNVQGKTMGAMVFFTQQKKHFGLVTEKDEQAGRLVRLGQLATSVIHEIKNPMQSISAMVQLMEYKYADNEPLLQSLQMINEEVYRANDLLVEFLGYSRVDDQVGYHDLNKVLHDGLKLNLPLCNINHIKVTENWASDLPQIHMDRNRIKQVVLNLVENSISAILEKQKSYPKFDGEINIATGYDVKNKRCYFTCTDNGIGMSEATLANFQKPFFTTKETGTGMGAAVSKTIVKLHGGTMKVESTHGKGSTFKIILPLVSNIDKDTDLYEEIAKLEF